MPAPNPISTPHSTPSPVVVFLFSNDLLLISSRMKNTVGPPMFPNSLSTCLVADNFSCSRPTSASIKFRIAAPLGCTIQNNEFQSLTPIGPNASTKHFPIFREINSGTFLEK
ncbi:hypothetical protein NC652_014195 [Populus alba x Populus x berolinensis]|nr:hypothetical protein NC652_014195 [Populus alba x Populus x berolinensis]